MSVSEHSESVSQLSVVLAALKELDCADLFAVVKAATLALEKATKTSAKSAPKSGSAPKGVQPPQLAKPRAWVEFTLQHALANGWEEFIVSKAGEEIVMPGSEEHNGAHVYIGSVDAKNPNGKQIMLTHAMSLSKQRWAAKAAVGTHEELYKEFCTEFDGSNPVSKTSSAASSASSTPKAAIVRKTAAEKAAELEAAKAAKEAEKAAAKAAKEAEKAAAKAAKEAEKAAAKAAKDAEKAAAKAAKPSPKAAVVVKAAVVKAAVKKPAAKVAAWSCPADGAVHPWPYKGKKFLRNSDNQVWEEDATGGCGEWQGVYIEAEDRIDDSVEEPSFDEE